MQFSVNRPMLTNCEQWLRQFSSSFVHFCPSNIHLMFSLNSRHLPVSSKLLASHHAIHFTETWRHSATWHFIKADMHWRCHLDLWWKACNQNVRFRDQNHKKFVECLVRISLVVECMWLSRLSKLRGATKRPYKEPWISALSSQLWQGLFIICIMAICRNLISSPVDSTLQGCTFLFSVFSMAPETASGVWNEETNSRDGQQK